ncbi:cellulase family glycosylhydrolase [Cellvibrio japonicus]|nr:cellulase family glycosylhydrolase [Cellvibrio japonicus]QEI17275.1 cellulase family glycosylhydrolase [Cellvibrio japonicus]QEI20852.1 cellulase family glycosylhydrolase [Cellvibrio japonicus]
MLALVLINLISTGRYFMKHLISPRILTGLFVIGLGGQAVADCNAPAWSSTTQYKGGEAVVYQGGAFKARWWANVGVAPDTSNPWDVWQFIQPCSSGGNSSSVQASASVSSSGIIVGAQCNWYGNSYPVCQQAASGWGWENQQSCIAYADCASLPAPYGVMGGNSSSVLSGSSVSSSSRLSSSSSIPLSSSLPSSSSSVSSIASSSLSSSSSSMAVPEGNSWTYTAASASITAPAQLVGNVGELQGAGSAVIWNVDVPVTGEYRINLTWSSPYSSKVNTLVMDGTALSYAFAEATVPVTYVQTKTLSAGNHSFGVRVGSSDWGYMNVHSLKLELLGGLTIRSPANFAQLPSGSNIQVVYEKQGSGRLTYSVNDGATQLYGGESPLTIPTQGDGVYRLKFGLEGTVLSSNLRVTVGSANVPEFVEASGTQFVLGNKPFYFNGSNQYYLMYKPEPMANDFFARAKALDMKVVRTWMFCNSSSTHDGVCINKKSGSSFILVKPESERTADEKALITRSFELFDNYVAQAEANDMRLVLSLSDYWDYFGKIEDYGPYGSASGRALFKTFITNLLNHVNPLTGKAYKDDPTIMMWELANEPRYTTGNFADFKVWVADIAAHIKSIAPHQLVSIGSESSFGIALDDTYASLVELNRDPNIDAISAHLYPTSWRMTDEQVLSNIQKLADLAREVGKPAYIGELGWPAHAQRTTGSNFIELSSFTDQAAVDSFVSISLTQRANYMESWYAKAYANKDAIGGFLIWQLSGKEWGNGGTPLRGCQWCAGPYGEPTGGWSGNHDGYQFYCALNEAEMSLTQLGALGSNKEGDKIHMDLHKLSCDVMKAYSGKYRSLMQ